MEPWEIVLICIASLVLLFVLFLLVVAIFFQRMMFKNRFKLDPLQGVYTKEILGLDAKPIEIPLKKIKMRGFIYSKGESDPNKIIVYCHGMWSCHNSYLQNIGYIASKGYDVIGFDYEGVESSDGKNIRGFGNSLRCCDYAIRFIKNNEELKNRDIYVVGHSWGGFATSNIAGIHKDIKGVVPLSPVIGVSELMQGLLPKKLRFVAYFFEFADFLSCGKYSYMNAVKSLNDYEGKVLFIHSSDDPMVKIDYSTNYVQRKTKNKNIKYFVMDDRGHQPHYTKEACDKLHAFNDKIKGMPKEELDELKRKTDFLSMGVVDSKVMDKIIELIEE